MSLTFPTPTGKIPIYVSRFDVLWLVLVRDVCWKSVDIHGMEI